MAPRRAASTTSAPRGRAGQNKKRPAAASPADSAGSDILTQKTVRKRAPKKQKKDDDEIAYLKARVAELEAIKTSSGGAMPSATAPTTLADDADSHRASSENELSTSPLDFTIPEDRNPAFVAPPPEDGAFYDPDLSLNAFTTPQSVTYSSENAMTGAHLPAHPSAGYIGFPQVSATWSGMTEVPTRAPALVPASHIRISTPASTPYSGTTTPILAPRAQLGMPHANIGSPASPLGTSTGTPEPVPRAGVFTPARAPRMDTNSPAPAPPAHIFGTTSPTTISDIGPQAHADMFAPAPPANISVPVMASGAGLGTLTSDVTPASRGAARGGAQGGVRGGARGGAPGGAPGGTRGGARGGARSHVHANVMRPQTAPSTVKTLAPGGAAARGGSPMRGGSVSARNGMPPSVRGAAAGRSNGPMFRVNLSAVTPGLNFASPSPAPTFDQPLYTMDGKMLTAVTTPLRFNTAMSNRPEVPRPEGTQGRTTNELTGKKGFNIQQSLMAPRFLYLAYLRVVHMLVYQAPLDLRKSWESQDELKKVYIYQQMNETFANTRLARCAANWGTQELCKQFLAGHRKRMTKLKKDTDRALAQLGSEEEMELLYLEESGEAMAPGSAAAGADDEWIDVPGDDDLYQLEDGETASAVEGEDGEVAV